MELHYFFTALVGSERYPFHVLKNELQNLDLI